MKFIKQKRINDQNGFLAIIVVIIISVSALIIVQNNANLSLGDLESGFGYSKGEDAMIIAEGCANSVISQIRKDDNYGLSGTINMTLDEGYCTIDVIDGGSDRLIEVSGTVGLYTKKIVIDLTVNNREININSWNTEDF
jgi:hypothetical protein